MTTDKILQRFALRLKNADPSGWDSFVEAFDVYTTEVTVAVTQAPAAEILVMQGRAQQCLALLRVFRECANAAPKPPAD
jgi:hypothetical protein